MQNDSLRQKIVPQSILTVEGVISINNSKNLKQEKKQCQFTTNNNGFRQKPKTRFFSKKQQQQEKQNQLLKASLCCDIIQEIRYNLDDP